MKTPIVFIAILICGVGFFCLGWYSGQNSATKIYGKLINNQVFERAYTQISEHEMLLEEIDAGEIDEAKHTLDLQMGGNILELNNYLTATNTEFPIYAVKMLFQMENDRRAKYGSDEHTAKTILARVAKYRAQHPWKYSGKMPTSDPEVDAEIAAILKDAEESKK